MPVDGLRHAARAGPLRHSTISGVAKENNMAAR
jgi:hypothetical protein